MLQETKPSDVKREAALSFHPLWTGGIIFFSSIEVSKGQARCQVKQLHVCRTDGRLWKTLPSPECYKKWQSKDPQSTQPSCPSQSSTSTTAKGGTALLLDFLKQFNSLFSLLSVQINSQILSLSIPACPKLHSKQSEISICLMWFSLCEKKIHLKSDILFKKGSTIQQNRSCHLNWEIINSGLSPSS